MSELIDNPLAELPPKLDPLQVYKLRLNQRLTFQQIGDLHGVTRQAANACYLNFIGQLGTSEDVASYEQAKPSLLSHVEERLIASCLDEDKLAKASLNNVAYALTQVHSALRLERNQSTSNVGLFSRIVQQVDAELFDTKGNNGTSRKKRHE